MKRNKILFMALAVLCGVVGSSSIFASTYSDTAGHYAESYIEEWSSYGVVEGYEDKTFKADNIMNRAEMAQAYANLFRLKGDAQSDFSDIEDTDWFKAAVSYCEEVGIINGLGGGIYGPYLSTTREQAFTAFGRAIGVYGDDIDVLEDYVDGNEAESWSKPYLAALIKMGVVEGVGNKTLALKSPITRGQMMTIFSRAIATYISEKGEFSIPEDDNGIVLVVASGASVTGVANNNIIISQSAEGGETDLTGLEAKADIYVNAANSTLVVSDKTDADKVLINADNVTVTVKSKSNVNEIEVVGDNAVIKISGTAGTITILDGAKNTKISGNGDLSTVDVQAGAEDTSVTTYKTVVKTSKDSLNTIAGKKEVTPGETVTTPAAPSGGGGSSSDSSTSTETPVTKYTVTFDSKGGSAVASQTVNAGNKATIPTAPTKALYTFSAWFYDGVEFDFNEPIESDVTLEAKWSFKITDEETLRAWVSGDIVEEKGVLANDIELTSELQITRALELDGSGNTITTNFEADNTDGTDNTAPYRHAICIRNVEDLITLKNLTVDSNSKTFGIHAYVSENIELENVTIKNSIGAGLTVNGSKVVATGLITDGNAWGGVNVTKGTGVTTDPYFELISGDYLNEAVPLYVEAVNTEGDLVKDVVKADEYQYIYKYDLDGNGDKLYWSEKDFATMKTLLAQEPYKLTIVAVSTTDGITEIFTDLSTAISNASEGATVTLLSSVDIESEVQINKAIELNGSGNTITTKFEASTDGTDNTEPYRHAICIRNVTGKVTIKDLIIDSTNTYGVHAYMSENIELENVTIKNSKGAGLAINSSIVVATNLSTSNNAWGGVNVDNGSQVTADVVPSFTLSGDGVLAESAQIYSEILDTTKVNIVANKYPYIYKLNIDGNGNKLYWSDIDLDTMKTYLDGHGISVVSTTNVNGIIEVQVEQKHK